MRKERQVAKVGDLFWVPIEDKSFVLGQVVEIQKEVLNSITCAFFDVNERFLELKDFDLSSPISIQFVTKDLFNNGTWQRITNRKVYFKEEIFPYRKTMSNGWIGAKVIGSGNIRKFLSAFYGLRPWDEMHDPNYYQKLLLPDIRYHGNT